MNAISEGAELVPTDKNYKAYVGDSVKFYYQHLSEEQRYTLVDWTNERKINFGYPGYFYRLPFFMTSHEP